MTQAVVETSLIQVCHAPTYALIWPRSANPTTPPRGSNNSTTLGVLVKLIGDMTNGLLVLLDFYEVLLSGISNSVECLSPMFLKIFIWLDALVNF